MTMTRVIGWRTAMGKGESGRREMAETRSGNDGCEGGRWWQWMTTMADDKDNNGDGGRRHWRRRTTTAANDDSGGRRWYG